VNAAPAHDPRHAPVLLAEVMSALAVAPGETHVDGTFGAGGYTRAILAAGAAHVLAFDRDPDAIAEGRPLVEEAGGRLVLVPERFSRMAEALAERGIDSVDGVALDIGVSSMQLDRPERGFSFAEDGPLSMSMEQSGRTAADIVNEADEAEIADILYLFGEERQSRRVARAIVAARPITRTAELAAIVRRALGHRPHEKKDPATRTFQALRIAVNRELEELEQGLAAAERVLKPGGRLCVVNFHSGEDRLLKRFLRTRSGGDPAVSRHLPGAARTTPPPTFDAPAKAVRASEAEVTRNPRSRSATLRWARRTAASPWPVERGAP